MNGLVKLPDVIQTFLSTGKWESFLGLDNGSRMNREVHVRSCEGLRVQFPWATHRVIHCRSKKDADQLRIKLEKRLSEFGLELHPTKTRIVYCKDDDRQEDYPETKFDFLGYTFRPRRSKNKYGKHFINFTPAVSNTAKKSMQHEIHDWRMHLKPDKTLEDLSHMFNPILRGWVNYYGFFYKSELYCVLRHMNRALVRWVQRKYKKFARHKRRASRMAW